ncbi:hypothetical protein Q7C36_004008 [Tachysurus vachellii]|uniref:C1q domain-containing protein n=1 Tax=Tachysurus vachellii TaxID=175792 RepID=A0AA88T7Z1_TACVA|nr:hypothetical protein Q7C36_004008 [Tachysurus vachellii]
MRWSSGLDREGSGFSRSRDEMFHSPVMLVCVIVSFLVLVLSVPQSPCRHCCDDDFLSDKALTTLPPAMPEIHTYINMTIFIGRSSYGAPGPEGSKGSKGQVGAPGTPCKSKQSAFSVRRRKALPSIDSYQVILYDTVFVNSPGHFDMFSTKFRCSVPGMYCFNVHVHMWNFKETFKERTLVYTYILLHLRLHDQLWVRLHKRENAIYSDDLDIYSDELDIYITFSGYITSSNKA